MKKFYKNSYHLLRVISAMANKKQINFPSVECSFAENYWIIGGIKFEPLIERKEGGLEADSKENFKLLLEGFKLEMEKRQAIPAYRKIRESQDIIPNKKEV